MFSQNLFFGLFDVVALEPTTTEAPQLLQQLQQQESKSARFEFRRERRIRIWGESAQDELRRLCQGHQPAPRRDLPGRHEEAQGELVGLDGRFGPHDEDVERYEASSRDFYGVHGQDSQGRVLRIVHHVNQSKSLIKTKIMWTTLETKSQDKARSQETWIWRIFLVQVINNIHTGKL